MNQRKFIFACSLLLLITKISGCPITIINDSNTQLFLMNETNGQAVRIAPHELNTIDTAPKGFFYSIPYKIGISKEKITIYVETSPGSNEFKVNFQIKEKLCTDNDRKNTFKFSEISRQIQRATERFYITDYQVKKRVRGHKTRKKLVRK